MAQKIAIAKAGFSGTTTNPDNLTFSSDYNTLKYYTQGSVTLTWGSATGTVNAEGTVNHNLGYNPFFVSFYRLTGTTNCMVPYHFADAGYYGRRFCYTTTTDLIFRSEEGNAGGSVEPAGTAIFDYKIFKNNLNI